MCKTVTCSHELASVWCGLVKSLFRVARVQRRSAAGLSSPAGLSSKVRLCQNDGLVSLRKLTGPGKIDEAVLKGVEIFPFPNNATKVSKLPPPTPTRFILDLVSLCASSPSFGTWNSETH